MAKEVLPHPGRCPCPPPSFIVLSVAEPFWVDSSGCMPALWFAEHNSQRLNTHNRNRSLGSRLSLESIAEVLAAFVGLPLYLGQ
jgi:hypothetical protein